VTIPHKQAVLPFLDELTPNARATGAANTIVVRPDGSLLGDNTDVPGFLADLAPLLPDLHPDGKYRPHPWRENAVPFLRAIVLGAGGAARAVTYALLQVGARVRIVNRTSARGLELRRAMEQALPDLHEDSIGVMGWDQLPELAHWADLIVNCTSLGLAADDILPWDRSVPFLPGQIVYDTIYNRPTELLEFARSCGATGINGLGMLVHQGARSFELWTERRAPVDVMARAIER